MKPQERGFYWIRFQFPNGTADWIVGYWYGDSDEWGTTFDGPVDLKDVLEIGPRIYPPNNASPAFWCIYCECSVESNEMERGIHHYCGRQVYQLTPLPGGDGGSE